MVPTTSNPTRNGDGPEAGDDGERGKLRDGDLSPTAAIVLFVGIIIGMMIYMAVGLLFAPEMPNKSVAPRYLEGFDLSHLDDASEEMRYRIARDRFWDRWRSNGLYLCVACVALYYCWQGLVRPRQAPVSKFDLVMERFGNTHIRTWVGTVILLVILAAGLILLLATLETG